MTCLKRGDRVIKSPEAIRTFAVIGPITFPAIVSKVIGNHEDPIHMIEIRGPFRSKVRVQCRHLKRLSK